MMISCAQIYFFYRTFLLRAIRFFVFGILLWLCISSFLNGEIAKLFLSLFSFFLIVEIFFRFKIAKVKPSIRVSDNQQKIENSFTLFALECFSTQTKAEGIVKKLLQYPQVKFILQKTGINTKELQLLTFSKEELGNFAFALVQKINGQLVTTMDLFTAYLLLTEPKTKLLFTKKLKEQELINILYWARFDFPNEENPKPARINFWGEGIGEPWVYGWTLETKKYTHDFTYKVLREQPTFIGRAVEHQRMVEILNKHENNNLLLVGEPGTGKTTLVETLCFESYTGKLSSFYHQRILELLVGPLLAGTQNQGDLEARLQNIIEEVSHAGNIILYIPEFQDVVGASTFHLDLSGALLPYLKSGSFRFMASCIPSYFKKYIEPRRELMDVFEVVKIEEPDKNLAIQMLLEKAGQIERKYGAFLTYKSIVTAVELAKRYIADKMLPGAAVTLLENTVSHLQTVGKKDVTEDDVVQTIEEKTKVAVASPKGDEKELLLHLEEKLHERIIDQEEGIKAIAESLRRLRTGLASQTKPISFLFLGPTGVGKTETAKALAALYFKGEDKIIRLDMSEYTTEDGVRRLLGAPPGEGDEKGELTEEVYENPFSLVLLDEFEKANPKILDLFLQVFDDGRLTDNKGKTVSFVNTMIIATSNAASEFIREEVQKAVIVDENFQRKLLDLLQTKGIFKPELLNRFDGIVVFKPLGENEVREITKLLLKAVVKKLAEKDITLEFDEKVMAKIIKDGFDKEFGARPLRRFIQDNIEDLLAQRILKDELKRGDKVIFSTDNGDKITTVIS